MNNTLLIIISTALVNNFVLSKFLGLCPLMGVTQQFKSAVGMACATTFVLTLTAILSYLINGYLLTPLDLNYLQIIVFIFTIGALVQLIDTAMNRFSPLLHQVLGVYLPLITTNCAVLGLALLNVQQSHNLQEAIAYGLGTSLGFALVLLIFSSLRERMKGAHISALWEGAPIALVTASILAMAFMGFSGLVTLNHV